MGLTHSEILSYAFASGLVAALNPCGFAMLPAYLSLVVSGEQAASARSPFASALRALVATAAMALGFLTVFGGVGLLADSLAWKIQRYLPEATILVGAFLLCLGLWFLRQLLRGREVVISLPKWSGGKPTNRLGSMFGYGIAYAIASMSCAFAPFLSVTSFTFQSGSQATGLLAYLAYASGMTLVVGSIAMAAALAHDAVAGLLRRALPFISWISVVLILLTGLYVAYYGWYEYQLNRANGDPSDPVVSLAVGLQRWLDAGVGAARPWQWGVIVAALLAVGFIATVVVRLWQPLKPEPQEGEPEPLR